MLSCQRVHVVENLGMKSRSAIAQLECNRCGKTGHLKKMCRQRERPSPVNRGGKNSGKDNTTT